MVEKSVKEVLEDVYFLIESAHPESGIYLTDHIKKELKPEKKLTLREKIELKDLLEKLDG